MAMAAGVVSVADDGTVTKSGMAEAIYDAFAAGYLNDTGLELPDGPDGAAIKKGLAMVCNHVATGVVDYIVANATANVGPAVASLQRSTAVGLLTASHAGATVNLPIT